MSDSVKMEALRSVNASIEKFSNEFYKILSKGENDNLICSPMSASIVLSMLALGARESTEEELRAGLFLPNDNTVTRTGIQSLIDMLNNVRSCELRLANRIFPAVGMHIKSEFIELIETSFRSTIESVDFKKVPEACATINSWCSSQTNGRVNDIATPGIINVLTKLVLVSAVYFKGAWQKTFKESLTQPIPFHINETISKNVPTMHNVDYYNYDKVPHLDAHYIELPYKRSPSTEAISMFVILPDAINGLKNIEDNLHKINFKDLHERRKSVRIMLRLPKFKIMTECDLQDLLEKLGMGGIFKPSANFLGISDPSLHVDKAVQKAFLEVNEEGSEAAAVTVVSMARCLPPRPPPEVSVDRPFFCAIVVTGTGTQLFNARVRDPVAN